MEHRVGPHGVWEAEANDVRRTQMGVGKHLERAESAVVQLR